MRKHPPHYYANGHNDVNGGQQSFGEGRKARGVRNKIRRIYAARISREILIASRTIPESMPLNTMSWSGVTPYQYIRPERPSGLKRANCCSLQRDGPSAWIRNSNSASPGSFIS